MKFEVPEWRNWQTRGTQNPVRLKPRGGSTPPSGTNPATGYALGAIRGSRLKAEIVLELCSNCASSSSAGGVGTSAANYRKTASFLAVTWSGAANRTKNSPGANRPMQARAIPRGLVGPPRSASVATALPRTALMVALAPRPDASMGTSSTMPIRDRRAPLRRRPEPASGDPAG